jgi:hypothetical protein
MRRTSSSDSPPYHDHRHQARHRFAGGEEGHAESEQQDSDREKEIIEAGHEAEAFILRIALLRPDVTALGNERAQGIRLRLRHHAGDDRGVEILALDAHSFSTVTLRLV